MGCNYYFKPNPEPRCPTCHRSLEETGTIHIGKSSYGWAFSFHGTEKIRSYADWLVVLEAGGEISSQYDEPIPLADFKALVLAKQDGKNILLITRLNKIGLTAMATVSAVTSLVDME